MASRAVTPRITPTMRLTEGAGSLTLEPPLGDADGDEFADPLVPGREAVLDGLVDVWEALEPVGLIGADNEDDGGMIVNAFETPENTPGKLATGPPATTHCSPSPVR